MPSTAEDYTEYEEVVRTLQEEWPRSPEKTCNHFLCSGPCSHVQHTATPENFEDVPRTFMDRSRPRWARRPETPKDLWREISMQLREHVIRSRYEYGINAVFFLAFRIFSAFKGMADLPLSFTGTRYESPGDYHVKHVRFSSCYVHLRLDIDNAFTSMPSTDGEWECYLFMHDTMRLAHDQFTFHGEIGNVQELACICADLSAARGEAYTRERLEWLIESLDGFPEWLASRSFCGVYTRQPFYVFWESCDFVAAVREEIVCLHAGFLRREERFRMVCRGRHGKSTSFLRSISDEHFKLVVNEGDLTLLGPVPREEWGQLVTEADFQNHPLARRWGVRNPAIFDAHDRRWLTFRTF